MKLNNKGFAFSTLLYGILAVIIVLLMIIFTLYTSAEDKSYYYATLFEENLNRCVDQEIALENCYATSNGTCDTTAYYACMGVDDKTITGKKSNFREYLLTKLRTDGGDGLTQIDSSSLKYIYKGSTVSNYVTFSGDNWRIIGITTQGEIKIGLFKTNGSLKWDNGNSSEWSTSSLNNYLNHGFYNDLSDAYMINKRNFYIGRIDPEAGLGRAEMLTNENNATFSGYVGLPGVSDYILATKETCNSNIINSVDCESWMTGYESWLINAAPSSQSKAIYLQVGTEGKLQSDSLGNVHNYIPVVYLSPETEIIEGGGDGSSGSPYKLGK